MDTKPFIDPAGPSCRPRRTWNVPRGRRSILYGDDEPRWQYKFMRRAGHIDASVQLVTMLRASANKFYRQGVDTPEELEDSFPSEEEDLFAYDSLIIGSFEAAFFSPKHRVAIHEFLRTSVLVVSSVVQSRHTLVDRRAHDPDCLALVQDRADVPAPEEENRDLLVRPA